MIECVGHAPAWGATGCGEKSMYRDPLQAVQVPIVYTKYDTPHMFARYGRSSNALMMMYKIQMFILVQFFTIVDLPYVYQLQSSGLGNLAW